MFYRTQDDQPLFSRITDKPGWDHLSADLVAHTFEQLKLPEPQGDEYFITSDGGYLIFLTPAGCTIRITSNQRCPPLEHHRILKPLTRFDLDNYRLDINPGLALTSSVGSAMRMIGILGKDAINFDDPYPRNCARIPGKCTGSFLNYTVVCDDGAYHSMLTKPEGAEGLLYKLIAANDNCNDIQERAFKSLRDAFAKARETHNPLDTLAAWKHCTEKKAQGHLRADWDCPSIGTPSEIKDIAQRYALRLQHLTCGVLL